MVVEKMPRTKEEYRRVGVPVGVGVPTDDPTIQELTEAQHELAKEDQMLENAEMAAAYEDAQYNRPMERTDRGQFIKQTTYIEPYHQKPIIDKNTGKVLKWEVVDGDMPLDVFLENFGMISKLQSNTFYTPTDVEYLMHTQAITEMANRMCASRENYTPLKMAKDDQTSALIYAKINQSRGGMIIDASGTSKTETVTKVGRAVPTRKEALMRKLKGDMD